MSRLVSIHAPYAGSDVDFSLTSPAVGVSIHAPYAGSDGHESDNIPRIHRVSIHAPYAGSD